MPSPRQPSTARRPEELHRSVNVRFSLSDDNFPSRLTPRGYSYILNLSFSSAWRTGGLAGSPGGLVTVPRMAMLALLSTLFITANLSIGYTFSTIAQNQLQAMQMSIMPSGVSP